MNIKITGSTKLNYRAEKSELDDFGGKSAGICYSEKPFENLLNENSELTEKRIEQTKNGGHHSVYGHTEINLLLEGIPKALAMFLNNEHEYNTSERSARYTKLNLTGDEQKLYEKWVEIFTKKITDRYSRITPDWFTDRKIKSLAQENARYLIPVFTPTTMMYSTSYRQLNYIYGFVQKELKRNDLTDFDKMMRPYFAEFEKCLKETGYIDDKLQKDGKGREFSLIDRDKDDMQEYFGDVYATTYMGSFAELAQAQRHRTLNYKLKFSKINNYFIPPIIKDDQNLVDEWLCDCDKQKNKFPQGLLVKIEEQGTYPNFILKMQERLCSCAQLEIAMQTKATLFKYIKSLKLSNHPKAEQLEKYKNGSRCTFPGDHKFECKTRCGFDEGITMDRLI